MDFGIAAAMSFKNILSVVTTINLSTFPWEVLY